MGLCNESPTTKFLLGTTLHRNVNVRILPIASEVYLAIDFRYFFKPKVLSECPEFSEIWMSVVHMADSS